MREVPSPRYSPPPHATISMGSSVLGFALSFTGLAVYHALRKTILRMKGKEVFFRLRTPRHPICWMFA